MNKRIIILGKSHKYYKHYCIGGIDYDTGEWIRLVSSDITKERAVPEEQLIFSNGDFLDIYDIIECDLLQPCPTLIQPENWLYNENKKWKKIGKSNLDEVLRIHGCDFPNYIFANRDISLPEDWKFDGKPSLCLVRVQKPIFDVKTFHDKQKIRLNFTYRGIHYKYMQVTQTDVKEYFKQKKDGLYPLKSDRVVVFSLTDKYYMNGKCYKVVAQILK